MTDLPVLKIKGLAKHFGHIKAVDGLNLHVSKGEIFGLLGHNGAGKSTTMRMLLSLIKPTSGRIEVFGSELYSNREKILSDIGSIIEKPDFYPWLSAKTNLELFAALSRKPVSKNRISQTLEFVGLAARAGDKVKTYSHGMKQRLGLAQAIVHDPALIIL
ncbi:MAG TPA: ATP-binding cassette domain-containing protein, partial [Saprospiraceae bacterium]|nr:ATP-binding cassette domain-containing protein [Saprospiraceae bacterium]